MTPRIAGRRRLMRAALGSAVVIAATVVLPAVQGDLAIAAPHVHTHPVHPVHGGRPGSVKGDVRGLQHVPSGPLTDPGAAEPEPFKSGGAPIRAAVPDTPDMPP